jgi:predicted nucleotidyltransferase
VADDYRIDVFVSADEQSEAEDLFRAIRRLVDSLGWDVDVVHLLREERRWVDLWVPDEEPGAES